MTSQKLADAALFARIRHWKEFRSEAEHLFPTDGALRWFIRQYEDALVAYGALLKLPRGNYVDPEPFRAAAINLMRSPTTAGASVVPRDSDEPCHPIARQRPPGSGVDK